MDRQQRDHETVAELPGSGEGGPVRGCVSLNHQSHARFKQDVAVDEPIKFGSWLHDQREILFNLGEPREVSRGKQLSHAAQFVDRAMDRHGADPSLQFCEETINPIGGDIGWRPSALRIKTFRPLDMVEKVSITPH